ncbi:MAG: anthranilate phosphoribosyltransferase [Alphaproteobacteria bacterium]|jgi:anthranilate phosphoribosyltransferase|nr:anthranilate phosphoribosyltransferase [Alphaproteobacteria bacterium]PPR12683.1 MAG: Anthranilate phosphoribosyltransferase [Alphaproteobacteria bacterium MarineAlpha12_Bin1]|tara:strand:- start:902 stop:1930 length:1029 start_codon:yes stop_codon:yes gene_type:complete
MDEKSNNIKKLINLVAQGQSLNQKQAENAFDIIMSGEASPAQIGAFLIALRVRGETVDEITGAARIMRAKALLIDAPENAIDIVGTGGDAKGTLNVSTGASFVVASCGVPIAKHGNRALSSKTGAADVLTALGVNIEASFELVKESIWENNIGFLMAPRHHSAMRNVGDVRVELATRTIFNILGPLSNPSQVSRQMVGVFAKQWVVPLAKVLGNLGLTHAWVVHGADGLDEISITGISHVAELKNGQVTTFDISPEDAGLKKSELKDIQGGNPDYNAKVMKEMLAGKSSAFRDIVLFNAAASLIVGGKVDNLHAGIKMAADAIDSGAAIETLNKLIEITNRS